MIPERSPEADFVLGFDPAPFGFERRGQQVRSASAMRQLRPIGDAEQEENADQHGRDGFVTSIAGRRDPAARSTQAVHGAPAAIATGTAAMKPDTMRARCQFREPLCEKQDHAGDQARLGEAEQKAQD